MFEPSHEVFERGVLVDDAKNQVFKFPVVAPAERAKSVTASIDQQIDNQEGCPFVAVNEAMIPR